MARLCPDSCERHAQCAVALAVYIDMGRTYTSLGAKQSTREAVRIGRSPVDPAPLHQPDELWPLR